MVYIPFCSIDFEEKKYTKNVMSSIGLLVLLDFFSLFLPIASDKDGRLFYCGNLWVNLLMNSIGRGVTRARVL